VGPERAGAESSPGAGAGNKPKSRNFFLGLVETMVARWYFCKPDVSILVYLEDLGIETFGIF
jgi:hypothetical protein